MGPHITVAHDFNCSWCWVALFQIRRMQAEFGAIIEWRGYELYPEGMDWPESAFKAENKDPNKPKTPSRYELMLAGEGVPKPNTARPEHMRTHNAHEALEHAKTLGLADEMAERLYNAYWLEGKEINRIETILGLAQGLVPDLDELREAILEHRYQDKIISFDQPAYASGVYNLPTFWIDGKRYAEQPYSVLRDAILSSGAKSGIYHQLTFPPAPIDRPYTVINMVSTIDGKTVSGSRNEPVGDLGSATDHLTMRQIQASVQAVMIGAGSLRATFGIWYPAELDRIVVTGSGKISADSRFFTDVPKKALVFTTTQGIHNLPQGLNAIVLGREKVDLAEALKYLREKRGIQALLVEGGSELNGQLLYEDLVDELFLTLTPKVKLGKETPTYADGRPLSRESLQHYTLLEQHRIGDELFLRYRRQRNA